MTKPELISRIAAKGIFTKTDSAKALDVVFETIAEVLAEGDDVPVSGFGKFIISEVPAKTRKYTLGEKKGQEFEVPMHYKVKFKPSTVLKDTINQ
ncbi:MAG: HU family DNA-binding protein [Enterococcus sp.]|nr:HU family DNA-binding protein [Enterococcus sp.]